MESKDYERHSESETIIIPPAHVVLHHLGAIEGYTRASNLVNNWYALATADKGKPANQDQTPV
jgi:hypothetical protein